ncbi:hypothetical protein [Niastella populi]|uniref:Uncharacterized protein n=1 Tax=Niastella populi TaxID=550983 RepID=A0A1V9F0M1_9BACT|nr:hypothetical protein [Niastella populi]OQP51897.1 hypothetical protein A4R26_29200 [Niastella populi]
MKNVLAQKGIRSVYYIDDNKVKHLFAYTQNMLENRIIMELYEQDNIEEPESDEGYKTGLSIYLVHDSKSYEFTMLFDTRPVVPRIYLYRSILDTVEIIETSNPQSLTANLEEAAMASVSTDVYPDKQSQDDFNNKIKLKIKDAVAMIKKLQ